MASQNIRSTRACLEEITGFVFRNIYSKSYKEFSSTEVVSLLIATVLSYYIQIELIVWKLNVLINVKIVTVFQIHITNSVFSNSQY